MRNKVGLWVAGVAACLALAVVGQFMVVPTTAWAHHAGSPPISCFAVTAIGDVSFAGVAEGTLSGRGKNARDIRLYGTRTPTWDLSFFVKEFVGRAECFSTSAPSFMEIGPDRDGSAHVTYGFNAFANDGATGVTYTLDMFGVFDDEANFPPTQSAPVNGMTLTLGELSTDAKGKDKKNSCTGDAAFFTRVDVVWVGTMAEDGSCP